MIILNNNYEVKKVLDMYSENWSYVDTKKITLSDQKDGLGRQSYDFYVVKFKDDEGHILFIYTTGNWLADVHVCSKLEVMEQAKEKLDNMTFRFVDMEKAKNDNRYDFRDELEIIINTYSEDIIEANFLEDNDREMEDKDWGEWRKIYDMTWKHIVGKIANILGAHDEDGIDEFDNDIFDWRNFDKATIEQQEALADVLHGHVLDDDTDDPIYNQIIINERDWVGEALEANGMSWDLTDMVDIVESVVIRTPKGSPLYYMLGGN